MATTYKIKSDTNQFVLVEKGVSAAGQPKEQNIGYYGSLEGLVKAVHTKMILCHGLDRLVEAMAAANELVLQAVALINEPGAKALKDMLEARK